MRRTIPVLAVLLGLTTAPAAASAPGPPLTVPAGVASGAVSCPPTFRAPRGPVLLVHGTGADAHVWDLGMLPALTREGFDPCRVVLPEAAEADTQLSAEYVVAAVRQIAADAGRPVAIVGHSQGGMLPRWAIKWWPDVRTLVSMTIGIEPSNHGAPLAGSLCAVPCRAAAWQQKPGSKFLTALNAGFETIAELPYTTISSTTDTTVPPSSSRLAGGPNVANIVTQTLCPGREVGHGPAIDDAATYALTLDALTHGGLASMDRVGRAVCSRQWIAGHDAQAYEDAHRERDAYFVSTYPMGALLPAEPALRPFTADEPPAPAARLTLSPRRVRAGRRATVRLRATGASGTETWPLPAARIRLAGRTYTADADGAVVARITLRRPGLRVATLSANGLPRTRAAVRATRR